MRWPIMQPIPQRTETLNVFGGLNQTLTVNDGEFSAMQNMTSDHFPVLSPRNTRLNCYTFTKCNGLYGKDYLLWVDGTALWYDSTLVDANAVADSKKTLVGMGAYVLIFPDKKVFNTVDGTITNIETSFITSANIQFSLCDIDGVVFTYTSGTTAPANPDAGAYWMDESGENPSLKRYSGATSEWVAFTTSYVRIGSVGIGANFHKYDGVKITGASDPKFNSDFILYGVGDDYIILQATISTNYEQDHEEDGPITLFRSCPAMDYLTECNNRVWGCAANGREIYSCRLGDPYNWKAYEGIDTDSYAVTVGSDGSFTGAATFQGNPVFFKENTIIKILGTAPRSFAVSSNSAPGVQYGSSASIAYVNGVLFYKGVNGVYGYDGGMPYEISAPLGKTAYKAAVGGVESNKYYLCMRDSDNAYHLFVYDTKTTLWHREDNSNVTFFASCQSDTFFVKSNVLWSITKNDLARAFNETEETGMEWYAVSGDLLSLMPDRKRVQRLQLSIEMASAATLSAYIEYNSNGTWEKIVELTSPAVKGQFTISMIPRRCDHYKLKLAGTGVVKVYSVHRVYEEGGSA